MRKRIYPSQSVLRSGEKKTTSTNKKNETKQRSTSYKHYIHRNIIIIKVIPAVPYIIIKLQYVVNRLNSVFYVCEEKKVDVVKMANQQGFSVR